LTARYDKEAVHILLSTPESTPPSASTTSLTPWLQNLTEAAINLLPDALNPSGTSTETGTEKKPETQVPIGTIRYVPKTNKLSRLAIMPDYRKYGFGRVLVDKLEEAAVEAARQGKAEVKDGKVLIKCHSQVCPLLSFLHVISSAGVE
jgi:GNAT superfamily N-acetyltransferase